MSVKNFLLDFLNEVYRACDALNLPVPDGVDTARTLEDLTEVAGQLKCRLVPVLVSSDLREFSRSVDGEKMKEIDRFFGSLPVFKLKFLPNPGYPVFVYKVDDDTSFFEAFYFPDTKACIISKFSYRDLQMFKTAGDADSDTRIALGSKACKCVELLTA